MEICDTILVTPSDHAHSPICTPLFLKTVNIWRDDRKFIVFSRRLSVLLQFFADRLFRQLFTAGDFWSKKLLRLKKNSQWFSWFSMGAATCSKVKRNYIKENETISSYLPLRYRVTAQCEESKETTTKKTLFSFENKALKCDVKYKSLHCCFEVILQHPTPK